MKKYAYRSLPKWFFSCCAKMLLSRLWIVDAGMEGSKMKTLGPKSGPVPPPPPPPPEMTPSVSVSHSRAEAPAAVTVLPPALTAETNWPVTVVFRAILSPLTMLPLPESFTTLNCSQA
ncbi:hypothetical protein [Stigmatella aurantiaca]|uniref:hypothetical protein n=1 Tax=Stigmatella aurantiaca TaxID=41 RepID=UPI001E5ABA63|nr:hypothetical protein [Stigmatella aurantiaca]